MSKIKTISDVQENSIADALTKLKRLEHVADLMHNNTYRAAQRDILRALVRITVATNTEWLAALKHHQEHGDMDGHTCLLSKCAVHYPTKSVYRGMDTELVRRRVNSESEKAT